MLIVYCLLLMLTLPKNYSVAIHNLHCKQRWLKQIGISNVTVLSNKWVLLWKQPVFGRLRQIIAHVAVGASADACDNNMTEVIFSSHQCVTGAISGTVFTGMWAVFRGFSTLLYKSVMLWTSIYYTEMHSVK